MNPVDVIANAIRVGDGQHTMGTGQLAEVAVATVAGHIAGFRSGDRSGLYEKGWDDALRAVLTALGHGDL